jgi:dynein heavy chain 1
LEATEKLIVKQKEIAERKKFVDEDLGKAEPALLAAKDSVDNIDTRAIKEVQGYMNPPALVVLTITPVYCLLENKAEKPAWALIKKYISNKEFIPNVKSFN